MNIKILTLMFCALLPVSSFTQETEKNTTENPSHTERQTEYEETKSFSDDIEVVAVRLDGRWRLQDKTTQALQMLNGTPIIYDKVKQVTGMPYLQVVSKGEAYLLDARGHKVLGVPAFDETKLIDSSPTPRYLGLEKAEKYAVFDLKTTKKTDFIYDRFSHHFEKNNNRLIFSQDDKYGVLDGELNERLGATVDWVYPNEDIDWLKNKKDGEERWGAFIYKTGAVIPPIYLDIHVYYEINKAFVQDSKTHFSILDLTTGKLLKKLNFPVADTLSLNDAQSQIFFVTLKEGKAGMVDSDNKTIVPHHYENFFLADAEGGKPFFAKKDGYYGLIDVNEKVYIPFEYEYLTWYSKDKLVLAEKNGQWRFLNIEGQAVCDWQTGVIIEELEKSFFSIRNKNLSKEGLVNQRCELIVPIQFGRVKKEGELLIGYDKHNGRASIYKESGELVAKNVYKFKIDNEKLVIYNRDGKRRTISLKTKPDNNKAQ